MPLTKRELKELLEKLSRIKGRHTELISVYIPAGQNINVVANQIEAEKSTADNIKSKTTRKNVMDALESISRELKFYKKTHNNGIAIFCGNVSEKEGQNNIKLWIIEPPQELRVRLYRCDKEFVLQPLQEMLEANEVYGFLVLDTKEATFALLEGKQIKILRKLTSGISGKHHAGGQCLSKDSLVETKEGNKKISEINIGDEIKAFDANSNKIIFTKCVNKWEKTKKQYIEIKTNANSILASLEHAFFVTENNKLTEKTAENMSKNDLLINSKLDKTNIISLKKENKRLSMIDIETESKNFFANGILVHNSSQRFERLREGQIKEFYRRIAEVMKELYFNLTKLKGIIIGGPVPTKEDFLKEGNLVTALKDKIIGMIDIGYADEHGIETLVKESSSLIAQQEIIKEKKLLENFFEKLGKGEKAIYKKEDIERALKLGAVDTLLLSQKLEKQKIKEYEEKANSISAKVELVSTDTSEGQQFYNLGGVGAILRFEV